MPSTWTEMAPLSEAADEQPCYSCRTPTRWRMSTGVGLPQCSACRYREESEAAGYEACPSSCRWCGGYGCPLPGRWR